MARDEDLCISKRMQYLMILSASLAIQTVARTIHSSASTPQTAKMHCLLSRERTLAWNGGRLNATMEFATGDAWTFATGLLCRHATKIRKNVLLGGKHAAKELEVRQKCAYRRNAHLWRTRNVFSETGTYGRAPLGAGHKSAPTCKRLAGYPPPPARSPR